MNSPSQPEANDAFEQLYRAHFRRTWRLLKRLGVAEEWVDDAAQDVFLVVHRRLDDLESRDQGRPWIYGIALRVASDYRRRQTRNASRHAKLPVDLPANQSDPVEAVEMRRSLQLLYELLSELDEDKRIVFVLAELEQMTMPEVAKLVGTNLNTIYSRLRAARSHFKKGLLRRNARSRGGLSR